MFINSINPIAQIASRHIISFSLFSQNFENCTAQDRHTVELEMFG